METKFVATMEDIVVSIKAAGYDPYEQLLGYISTGKEEYITRTGDAREKVKKLNWLMVEEYVERMKKPK